MVVKAHGYCLAGGTEILSMADIAFVADDARIGYPPMRGMTTPDTLYFPWKMSMARAKYLQLTGNSVTGREAAEMGWVAKSFPPEQLEEAVMRELRPMTQIAPDLLAANKQSVNQAYEIMGFRTALSMGWQWHALSSRLRPNAGQFAEKMREGGLKAALDWRDGPFKREGLRLKARRQPIPDRPPRGKQRPSRSFPDFAPRETRRAATQHGTNIMSVTKLLIANRGEIAIRIARAAADLGSAHGRGLPRRRFTKPPSARRRRSPVAARSRRRGLPERGGRHRGGTGDRLRRHPPRLRLPRRTRRFRPPMRRQRPDLRRPQT